MESEDQLATDPAFLRIRALILVFVALILGLGAGWAAFRLAASQREKNEYQSRTVDAAIKQIVHDLIEADDGRDPDRAAGLFTDDAVIVSHGMPPISGRVAIRQSYRHDRVLSPSKFELHILDVVEGEDLAFVRASVTRPPASSGEPGRPETGNFFLLLKRDSEQWRIARLVWSASRE